MTEGIAYKLFALDCYDALPDELAALFRRKIWLLQLRHATLHQQEI